MYNILLVDDELPALRYMETIIKKYAPDYTVIQTCRDGAEALSWLKEHVKEVDLLLTDIAMPDMDGITLAKAARALREDLHIVIISGYQEFEYAHGAIEAAVDDYILKPASVSYMTNLFTKIKLQLNDTRRIRLHKELVPLLTELPYDKDLIGRIFDPYNYYFALVRYGNVIYPQKELKESSIAAIYLENGSLMEADHISTLSDPGRIYFLHGRDDGEFIC